MTDEALRALERAARAGDQGALLAWAQALVRVGRDPAPATRLAAGAAWPATLPCWSGLGGDGQQNRACDVLPLREAPQVAWRRDLPPRTRPPARAARLARGRCLLGGWAGLVVVHREPPRVECVDPLTGATRWSAPVAAREPRVVAEALVLREHARYRRPWTRRREPIVREGQVVARDLQTGELLFTWPEAYEVGAAPGWLVGLECQDERSPGGTVWAQVAREWPDPRRAPVEERRWTAGPVIWHRRGQRLSPLGIALLVEEGRGATCLHLETGGLLWRQEGEGLLADGTGLLTRRRVLERPGRPYVETAAARRDAGARGCWTLVDLGDGEELLDLSPELLPLALGRGFVVARPWGEQRDVETLVHLDRETGSTLARLERPARPSLVVAIARDVLYTARAQDGVEAHTARGELLWRLPWSALGPGPRRFPAGLLPLDRRLVVAFDAGDLVALG